MAFDPAPNDWIPGWEEDATDITIPIASFPQLTAAEADGETGDIRKVLFAVMEQLFGAWNSREAADRPQQMRITKSTSIDVSAGVLTNNYSLRFFTEIEAQEVIDEPA